MAIYQSKNKETGKVEGYYYSTYYKDVFGNTKRKRSKVFKLKKECQLAEQEFLNKANAGMDNAKMKYYIDLFLSEKKKRWNERTYYDNETLINKHITPTFGDYEWTKITPIMCKTWFDNLDGIGVERKNRLKRTLSNIFKFCQVYSGIVHNPANAIEYESEKEDDTILSHIWSVEEFKTFLDNVQDYELRTLYYVLFWTGLRLGEIRGLMPTDINFEKNCIKVTKQVPSRCGVSKAERVKLKTKTSKRTVYFNQETAAVLKEYLEHIKQFIEYKEDCYLFGITGPYPVKKTRDKFHLVAEQTGLRKLKIHDLRHCRASYLICNGFNIMFVCNQLGHKKPSMTLDVYSELMEELNEKEVNKLNQII